MLVYHVLSVLPAYPVLFVVFFLSFGWLPARLPDPRGPSAPAKERLSVCMFVCLFDLLIVSSF